MARNQSRSAGQIPKQDVSDLFIVIKFCGSALNMQQKHKHGPVSIFFTQSCIKIYAEDLTVGVSVVWASFTSIS